RSRRGRSARPPCRAPRRAGRASDLEGSLYARTRGDLGAPALEVGHAREQLGESAPGAPVAGVEREVGDADLVARGVLALRELVVPHLEVVLEPVLEHAGGGGVR